jgi:RecA-family ATPase
VTHFELVEIAPGNKVVVLADENDAVWRKNVMTAADLQREEFPPIFFIVPGLIPEGLTLMAGRPKIGKSWAALEMCLAVATGGPCFGNRRPITGEVLYVALEDNPRRLQHRIGRLLSPTVSWPSRLSLTTKWRRLDDGGVADLERWVLSVEQPRLIVIDTLVRVRPIQNRGGYTEDYAALMDLHHLADKHRVAILVLHHTRKGEAEDPVDTISGTLGLAGCADTALVLSRTSKGTTLYIRGRDIEESELAIAFDPATCRWSIIGDAAVAQRSNTRHRILAALEMVKHPMSPEDIATVTAIDCNTVRQRLLHMVADGEVVKVGRGAYAHPIPWTERYRNFRNS